MKAYDEMAQSVLKRRDQYVAEKRRQRKTTASVLSCFCVAALIGVGVWRFGAPSDQAEPAISGVEVSTDEETDTGDLLSDVAVESDSDYANKEAPTAGTADRFGSMDGDSSGCSAADGDSTGYSIQKMISSFGDTKMDSDISVNNGGVLFSDALTGAMEQYGDEVKYRVIVELFSDGAALDCADDAGTEEMERFAAEGYTVAFESYNDGYVDHNYFTLHATLEQLENFPADEQYGYCVMLYGERIEATGELQDAISGTAVAPSVTADAPVQDDALPEQTN